MRMRLSRVRAFCSARSPLGPSAASSAAPSCSAMPWAASLPCNAPGAFTNLSRPEADRTARSIRHHPGSKPSWATSSARCMAATTTSARSTCRDTSPSSPVGSTDDSHSARCFPGSSMSPCALPPCPTERSSWLRITRNRDPDYVPSSARSGGLARAAVFLGSRASVPAGGARSAAFASLAAGWKPALPGGRPATLRSRGAGLRIVRNQDQDCRCNNGNGCES